MKKTMLILLTIFSLTTITHGQNFGWKDISVNIPEFPYDTVATLTDVFFVNDNEGWITTNHSYNDTAAILHTIDGCETFEVQTTLYSCNAIHMLNENEGYAGGESGFVYRTVDGGENWNFHGTMVATLTDISFAPSDSIGYCCGINGNIGKITHEGVSQMNSGVPDTQYGISFPINSTEGWVCGGSIIRHYINETWTAYDQDYPSGGYNEIYMFDSLNGWIVGDGGIIAHTTDGKNWFEQTNPDPETNTFFDIFFLNSNEGWAVGLSWLIEHTSNGGADWTIQNIGNQYEPAFTGVHFTSSTNGYVVGNNKTLLKYTEISGIGDKEIPIEFELFPNPVKDKLQIRCSDFKTESGIIEICNIDGKKILKKEIRKGNENIEIDVSHLETGMYLCKISTDHKSSTKKLIKE